MRVRYDFSSRMTGRARMGSRKQRKEVPQLIKDLLDICDIVLEVIDARFIEKTRNFKFEQAIRDAGKSIIFVINKTDLVDMDLLRKNPALESLMPYVLISSKDRKGVRELRERIKIEVKRLKITQEKGYKRAQVGIIGYPNTGKSTLINVLSGGGSAKASPTAGYTKGLQRVRLTKDILLLDSPGVIPEDEHSDIMQGDLKKHAEIGVKMFDKVRDPESVIYGLMNEYPGILEKYYGIDYVGDSEILLQEVGKKHNFLKKGGEVDMDRAARFILREWQKGTIRVS